MSLQWPDISFQDRMATAEFRVHERAHIVVNSDSCNGCTTRACVVACPANLFVPTSDGGIVFNYEQCFECGLATWYATKKVPLVGPTQKVDTASCSTTRELIKL